MEYPIGTSHWMLGPATREGSATREGPAIAAAESRTVANPQDYPTHGHGLGYPVSARLGYPMAMGHPLAEAMGYPPGWGLPWPEAIPWP